MPTLTTGPYWIPVNSAGQPYAACKANFYITGTSTRKDTYSDYAMTTPNANPVVADSAGRFGPIFLKNDVRYRVDLTTTLGAAITGYPIDDVGGPLDVTYARTSAESAATVTPTNYAYLPGNVLRYGADNTGVTDATSAIQAALDSNDAVYMPTGTYKMNQTTVAAQLTIKRSGIRLYGDGYNTILYHSVSGVVTGTQGVVNIFPTTADVVGVRLSNFRIVGPTPHTGGAIFGTNRVVGMLFHDGTSAHIVKECVVENVLIEKVETAGFCLTSINSTANCQRIKFINCTARDLRQDGFNDFAGASTGIEFIDCNAYDCDGFGHEHASAELVIDGGTVRNCGQAGISIDYNGTYGALHRRIIRNVTISDIGTAAYTGGSGITLGQSVNPTATDIFNCDISRTGGSGIILNLSPSDINIVGNVIRDIGLVSGNCGISSGAAVTYTHIKGNTIGRPTGAGAMTYGITLAGVGSATNLISDNEIIGESTAKISVNFPTRVSRSIPTISSSTGIGNVGAGVDNLISLTIPARTLDADVQHCKITAWGTTAGNGNNKQVRLVWGGTQILATGAIASNGRDWRIECTAIRRTSSTINTVTGGQFNYAIINVDYIDTAAQDFTVDIAVTVTGEGTADNDIVCYGLTIEFPDGY